MSQDAASPPAEVVHDEDATEAVVHYMPVVIPLAGAVMMFLLAFIAIYMA